jgi:hypothetical protein
VLKELFNPLKRTNLDLGDVMIVWQLNLPVQSVHHHFQQYFSYIVVVSFIGGGNQTAEGNHRPVASH